MKNIIYVILLLNTVVYSQTVVGLCSGQTMDDLPAGSYIKDLNNDFDKFEGTWRWTNGEQTLTFVLEKVVHGLNQDYGSYRDYMIGNYSYTTNYGNHTVVNTIITSNSLNPENSPMYTSCVEAFDKINFGF